MNNTLHKSMASVMFKQGNLFDNFMSAIDEYHEKAAHTIAELKSTTKQKGDLWEEFCCLYLTKIRGFEYAWCLNDIPKEIKSSLGLGTKNLGIDIVAYYNGFYYAIQCKYRKNSGIGQQPKTSKSYLTKGYKSKGSISWKELSTFYALCARTGPWAKHIVITNCHYVTHANGSKSDKDMSICLGSFSSLTTDDFRTMLDMQGSILNSSSKIISQETVRNARLKFLETLNK